MSASLTVLMLALLPLRLMRLDVSESSAVLCINDMQGRRITILPVLVHTFHAVGRTYGQPYNVIIATITSTTTVLSDS